jgi:hypothetical protein
MFREQKRSGKGSGCNLFKSILSPTGAGLESEQGSNCAHVLPRSLVPWQPFSDAWP